MVEYKKVNLTLSNQQIKKLKEIVKSNNGTILRIVNKNFNKAKLLHELYLTQTQINKLREKVENNKIIKSGGGLGSMLVRFLPKLIKPALSLGKNILAPLGLSAPMSATDAAIQNKMYGSRNSKNSGKTVGFYNKDLNDMTKIVKALDDSYVIMKGVTETIKSDMKKEVVYP